MKKGGKQAKAEAARRKLVRDRFTAIDLPDWNPLRFVYDGTGNTWIYQHRSAQDWSRLAPELRALLPDPLPDREVMILHLDLEGLRRRLAPDDFAKMRFVLELLREQAQTAFVAVPVARQAYASSEGGTRGNKKSRPRRSAEAAKKHQQIAELAEEMGGGKLAPLAQRIADRDPELGTQASILKALQGKKLGAKPKAQVTKKPHEKKARR